MSYFLCVCCNKPIVKRNKPPAKKEEELFFPILKMENMRGASFKLTDMRSTPVGSSVARNFVGDVPYVITVGFDSRALINKGPKENRCGTLFMESLKGACRYSKSVSLLLWWSHGWIYTEIVPVIRQCKLSFDEFEKIFPDIEENVLYVVHRDCSKYHEYDNH